MSARRLSLRTLPQMLLASWRRSPLLWSQVLCVFAFFVWAALCDLDVSSHAQGQVIPAGQLKRIQHLEGGIVREIKVSEGQHVASGAVIAEMEAVTSGADVSELRSREANLEAKVQRLTATLAHAGALNLPAGLEKAYPAIAADARSAFNSYRERYAAMLKTYESRLAQRRAEIQEAKERLAGLRTRSRMVAEQVKISEQMLKQKLTNEYEHLQLQKEQAQIDADRDTTVANQHRTATAVDEAEAALVAFRSEEEVTLRKDLLESNTELASLKERLRKPSDSFQRTTVRSPTAGTVMTLYVKNSGAVVAPGGIIATLVPEGESLLIEARLPIADVGYVLIGAPARLSLAGGSGGFSSLAANVVHVSPDAAVDEKTGNSYYVVRLKPQQLAFHRGRDAYPLKPGVQVTAAIMTGERSVLALLFDSFIPGGVKPLRER